MHVTAENLSLSISDRDILSAISVSVASGTSLALVGPSGCGKTTLLNCFGMLLRPTSGRITADGADITRLRGARRRRFWRDQVAFIFQDAGLVPDETVGFNVDMNRIPLGRPPKDWGEAVNRALDQVGLSGRGTDPVSHLSGGERQRVGVARSIHKQAHLVLADEPTASLDAKTRQSIQELMLAETARGATLIVATHDAALAAACDQVLELG